MNINTLEKDRSLKKEKTEIEAKPLSNIILDIKILVHWSIVIANNINKIVLTR